MMLSVSRLVVTAIIFIASACGVALVGTTPQRYTLHEFSKHGVQVVIAIEVSHDGTATLLAEFSPTDPTLHLYSKDLPTGGINGIGRPTLLAIKSGPLVAAGQLVANVADYEQKFLALDKTFRLYPAGAVTLAQEVNLVDASLTKELTVTVTYMACSSEGYCLPPVSDYVIATKLPDEFRQQFHRGNAQ